MTNSHPQDITLVDLDYDVERLVPPVRRLTWYNKLVSASQASVPVTRTISLTTTKSARRGSSISWLKPWSSTPTEPPRVPEQAPSPGTIARETFIYALTGKENRCSMFTNACDWYASHLEGKIRDSWITLFRPILVDVDKHLVTPGDNEITISFQFLTMIAIVFKRKEELALTTIYDELYNKKVLVAIEDGDDEMEDDDRTAAATQLVFKVVGWMSFLYCPKLEASRGPGKSSRYLEIVDPNTYTEPGRTRPAGWKPRNRSKTYTSYDQLCGDNRDQALHLVLRKFGSIIPTYHRESFMGLGQDTPMINRAIQNQGWLETPLLCFHTLCKVGAVEIEWVDSLSLHLEFDSHTKKLKVFQYPSACLVLFGSGTASLLCKLLQDSGLESNVASEYFKEVILTYRLIFGNDKRSWQDFNHLLPYWEKEKSFGDKGSATRREDANRDALLLILCGRKWSSEGARDVYDEIEAEDPYSRCPVADFPFLGKRLMELQNYMREQNPSTISALWHDRRNVSWWWTFWAVIFIGGLTLILAFIQTCLQILQVVLSKQQIDQGHQAL